jgi:hypothetical protein
MGRIMGEGARTDPTLPYPKPFCCSHAASQVDTGNLRNENGGAKIATVKMIEAGKTAVARGSKVVVAKPKASRAESNNPSIAMPKLRRRVGSVGVFVRP